MPSAEQVILGYNNQVDSIRAKVVLFAKTVWLGSDQWRDADVDRLVAQIVPRVQAGQIQIANLTSAYIAAMAQVVDKQVIAPIPVDREEITGARGVDPYEVYRRPAVQMYTALSKGISFSDALSQSVNRLTGLVSTDTQLARTHQERASYPASGYRYTIRTLTGKENCGLCVIASTQRYNAIDLRPIHPGCDCGSRQISANFDPGQIIDAKLLEDTHAEIERHLGATDRGARDLGLSKTVLYAEGERAADFTDLIVTNEHSELGPVLSWRSDQFTSAADIAALS